MDIDWTKFMKWLGDVIFHPFMAGMAGSLVALRWAPGKSWWDRFFNVCSTIPIVIYGGPAMIDLFGITTDSMILLMGFAIGALGLNIFAKLYEGIKQTEVAAILSSYFKRG